MMTPSTPKFAFFGTPPLAVDILEALAAAGYIPSLLVTMPDRPQGRGMELRETAVAAWGRARGIPVLKPEKLDAETIYQLATINYQLAVVVAYGKILPQSLLDAHPMYNIHYSLLPRWRGATPVESAILTGDTETGVAIQRIVFKLDAGPLVALQKTPIEATETTPQLRSRLNALAAEMLVALFPALLEGRVTETVQDESEVTHCGKITKEDGLISLVDSGIENYRKFRAYFGWPGIYTFFERGGKQIRTIITACHLEGSKLILDTVKPEGKGEMPYEDFVRSGAKPIN